MDRTKQIRDAVKAAKANGWTRLSPTSLSRTVEHVTPQFAIDNGWWPEATYTTCEFLSFVSRGPNRPPTVIGGVSYSPWTARTDRAVSLREALRLMAQPLSESEIHDRD